MIILTLAAEQFKQCQTHPNKDHGETLNASVPDNSAALLHP